MTARAARPSVALCHSIKPLRLNYHPERMTLDILTAAGEEFVTKNALDTATVTVGLYLDATDAITDADEAPGTEITTEPTNTNYARATVALSAAETAADQWGAQNDGAFSFDFSDYTTPTKNVDGVFILANFSSVEGDGGGAAADWIIATAGLSQTRDVASVDSIDFAAGDLEINFE